jgi:O-antigen/teichoic acid export membrane protein
MRDLVRTLEIPYWLVGLLISVIVVVLSPFIAYHWVNAEKLPQETVRTAIMIMGLAVAFQWPMSLYTGGLMGLQRQVLLNGIHALMATFRGVGAVIILWLVSSTVEAFFLWQIVISAVHTGVVVVSLWRSLPYSVEKPRFRRELLGNIRRFAAGMTGITVVVTILMQLDKIILSRMLSLKMFGWYTLAGVVAMTLYRFAGPVFSAAYPRLTNLVALGATEEMTSLYHKSAQLVSVLVIPAALMLALFSQEILLLWTQSPETAGHTHVLVSVLVTGTAIHCLMHIPYALQLANGWTRLAFLSNLVSVLLLTPLMIVLTKWYGAVGAASVWVILNAGYMFISLPLMHRRLLPAEQWRWYFEDVARPLCAAAVVALAGRWIIRPDWSPLLLVASLGLVSGATLLASACAAGQLDAAGRVRSYIAMLRLHIL